MSMYCIEEISNEACPRPEMLFLQAVKSSCASSAIANTPPG